MGHLPVHPPSPGLLAHPAASALALDQLEGGQVVGMVVEEHETAGAQQCHHLAQGRSSGGGGTRKTGLSHGLGLGLGRGWAGAGLTSHSPRPSSAPRSSSLCVFLGLCLCLRPRLGLGLGLGLCLGVRVEGMWVV